MDTEETPVPLPSAPARQIAPNITLQPPLSRRGHGPGLILILPHVISETNNQGALDLPPLQKWAEEGYSVVEARLPQRQGGTKTPSLDGLKLGIEALDDLHECDVKGKFGLIVYDTNTLDTEDISSLEDLPQIVSVVSYGSAIPCSTPQLVHIHGKDVEIQEKKENITVHKYPEANSPYFVIPHHKDFDPSSASVAHSRSLSFLKSKLGGPIFDLEAIWDEHTYFEFGDRSVAKTMGTMVQEPYVNHVPTVKMTGGIGRERLSNFYRYHFIWNNPDDTKLELVSRTVGVDRIVDEFVFCFSHNKQIDWLAPGIPPTNRAVRLPMVSIVNVRGDRLYHEHIWWDQASLLTQLGLLPEYLPFPYILPDGRGPAPGKKFEYRVPAAGEETAKKLVDENSVESNGMFSGGIREV